MEFEKVVSERYSCKKFNPNAKISKEQLNAILDAGKCAPTAKNTQEHHVYVLESNEALAKFDKATPCRYGATTVLVVTYDKNNVFVYPGDKVNSGVEDATIVATHMLLAAKNQNVDSCWINFFNPETFAKDLGLPENEEIVMALDLGIAAEDGKPLQNHFDRKDISKTVTYL